MPDFNHPLIYNVLMHHVRRGRRSRIYRRVLLVGVPILAALVSALLSRVLGG